MAQGKDPVTTRPNGGSDRSHQIEAEIDRTRAAMDRTVDAISGKLTPQQLMLEAMGVFKDGSSAFATQVVETARAHPVPATIIGIGLGLLLTEKSRGERSVKTADADTGHRVAGFGGYGPYAGGEPPVRTGGKSVKDKTAEVKDAVALGAMEAREMIGDTAAHVKEQAAHVKDQVAQGAEAVREQAAQVPAYARQQWHDAQLGFWQTMDQKPFAIGAAALAAGVCAGLAVPSSRKEKELMGETRDRLLDQAKELGREAVDKGRQVARVATDVVKTEAGKQGLNPAAVAEKVRTISREAEQALKKEVDKVVPEPLVATGAPMPGNTGSPSPAGGAAGRGMSSGFASASETWDPDSTVPGPVKTPTT
jgi:hypothetical protein